MYPAVGPREINRERDMVADLRRFVTTLEGRGYTELRLRWAVEDGETPPLDRPRRA